ncbi:MAG: hypothetical protein J6Y19_08530 [Kiritimatiellae bacterium]|nr:hypothetical protein [Kiritimatiellia bacterium]
MKKWLVGLMAAGLCVTSAWASGVATLPVAVNLSNGDMAWTSFDGFTGKSLGIYGDGRCKFDGNGDTLTVQFDAAPGKLSFDLKGNTATTGTSPASFTVEASADGETWDPLDNIDETKISASDYTSFSYDLDSGVRYVRWTLVNKYGFNFGLNNLSITSGGPAEFYFEFDRPDPFEVEQGAEEEYIVATAYNYVGPVSYDWPEVGGSHGVGNIYTINTDDIGGPYTVEVTCTDQGAEGTVTYTTNISYSVVGAKQSYTVAVEDDIQNGTVEIQVGDDEAVPGPVQVKEGTIVTVIATPADRTYQIESITVETEGGTPVGLSKSNTFEMPAENVWVGATFVEKPAGGDVFTKIASADALEEGEYVFTGVGTDGTFAMQAAIPESGTKFLQCKFIEFENDEIENPDEDLVWTLAKNGNNWTIHNDAVGFVGYLNSGNSANAEATATDNSSWTITYANGFYSVENVGTSGRFLHFNTATNAHRFACYTSVTFANSMSFFKKESGEKPFSITLDPAADFEVELNAVATVTATPKNAAEGDVSYEWTVGGTPVDATGAVLTLDTSAVTAEAVEVGCKATDASGAEATASVSYTVKTPAEPHAVNIAIGTQHGFVTADPTSAVEGTTITLTATAEDGYKLASMTVTYGETTLTFTTTPATFEMPDADVYVGATFVEKPVVAGFTKITSLDELTEGEYVITGAKAAGEEYAMMASIAGTSTKYIERRAEAVTIEEEITVTDAEDSIIWTLAQGDNGWTIYNEAVGYAGYVAGGNSSGAETNASAKSSWTITASETAGLFLLENVDTEGRYLLYNASSPRFACYTNLTSGKHLALYKGSSGPAPLRVSLDQENPLRLDVGTGASVTATATGGEKPYTFAWECSTAPELNGTGETLAIPDTLGLGTYNVWLTVSDSSDPAREIIQAFVVVVQEPAAKYAITVERVPGGVLSVEGDKTEAEEGETVKVTATADEGMKLAAITVTGDTTDLSFTSSPAEFPMPAEAVTISATFVEFEVPPYYFQFESNDLPTGYAATEANVANTGSTATEVATVPFTLQRAVRGNAEGDKKAGVAALRLAPLDNTNSFAYNSKAFSEAITAISFEYAKYGTDSCDFFAVSTSSDGENWTLLADLTSSASGALQTYENSELPENTYFVRFDATNSVKGNSRRINIDEIQLFTGAPKPSVSLSVSSSEIVEGDAVTVTATAKNFSGDVEWAWEGTDGGSAEGAVYTVNTAAAGTYTITATATYGEETASKSVTITVNKGEEPPPPSVTLTCDPASVTMAEGGSAEVTVTLAGVDSFDGYIYIVDHEDMCSEEGENPWTFDLADLGLSASDEPYVLTLIAYDGDGELAQTTLSVTVTSGGGSGGEEITEFSSSKDGLRFKEPSGTYTVESTKDLVNGPWEAMAVTVKDGYVTIPLEDGPRYYRVATP